jgi:hypothetical protein
MIPLQHPPLVQASYVVAQPVNAEKAPER